MPTNIDNFNASLTQMANENRSLPGENWLIGLFFAAKHARPDRPKLGMLFLCIFEVSDDVKACL